jgi:hypothetical protein
VRSSFDRRVVPDDVLELVRVCQRRVPCHLAGGAALSGAHLAHRLSNDIDLFCHAAGDVRELVRQLPDVARDAHVAIRLVRDAGTFVRADVTTPARRVELDIVFESTPDIEPPPAPIDGVIIASLADLRAAKITCILSRSEPRDLVDLCFLDRAGHPPEADVAMALQKDAGIDPGILAMLLEQFPTRPLPLMLAPLTEDELVTFRDALRERFRRLALPKP